MNSSANYTELASALRPEIALTIGLLALLGLDLALANRATARARRAATLALGLLTLAVAALLVPAAAGPGATLFDANFAADALARVTRLGILALSALSLLLTTGFTHPQSALPGAQTPRHHAEFAAIQLLATTGFTLMAASNNLLVAFLGLELASLSLYILAAFDKTSRASAEAGLKYFLFGGMAAAFMLLGFSLIYGLTGALDFPGIAAALAQAAPANQPLILVSLILILVGFGYKAAAAPFHFWAPDVYQGAPTPSASLIASASKLAGFIFFARLLVTALAPVAGSPAALAPAGWITLLALVSAASVLLGNLVALAQPNVRRLIAYSAISHAGAMLIGAIAAAGPAGPGPLCYYAITYGLATIGIFGVFSAIERTAPCQRITDLAGLWKRSPFLSIVLFICVLSLAGVPPLAGFLGKFSVFAAALTLSGLMSPTGLAVLLAIAMSAVGLYYYLIILKTALVTNPPEVIETTLAEDAAVVVPGAQKIKTPCILGIALTLITALILALGILPGVILHAF
jgi:NADH-quinone oxidoreductase subunit N